MAVFLAAGAVVISLIALGLTLQSRRAPGKAGAGDDVPEDVAGLRAEVIRLQEQNAEALRHLAIVRYDAFADLGGKLSWSLAVLDPAGDGVVLTSIRGRDDSRTYAKEIAAWAGQQELSPEEREALEQARRGG